MESVNEKKEFVINDEQKIRVTFSKRARTIIAEDMDVFGITKLSTFLNLVFKNFRSDATSSIFLHLQQRELELEALFSDIDLEYSGKKLVIERILATEEKQLLEKKEYYTHLKEENKIFHINKENRDYLLQNCEEAKYYNRPSLYLCAIFEEYCSLPFIQREKILRKEVYEIIEKACYEKRILKVKAILDGKDQLFYVYPYKIVPDPFHTQSYLACYSRKAEEPEHTKIVASFSMARIRITEESIMKKTFYLNQKEIANIEAQLSSNSSAYLLGKPERIEVRLTENGKFSYKSRLFSRPEKIEELSHGDIFVFDCTQQQIINYFFSFGQDAEILRPKSLRDRFQNMLENALKNY